MIVTIDVNNTLLGYSLEIEFYLIKLVNRKKKLCYLRLHHTMQHKNCEGHKFAQNLQNCT